MATVAELLNAVEADFRLAGLADPRHEAAYLIGGALSLSPASLHLRQKEPLPEDVVARVRAQARRRSTGEPADYVLGWKDFRGRRFAVSPAVLIPRPETEMLVDLVVTGSVPRPGRPARILDVGTGSGCIAVSVALDRPEAEVVAVDLSAEALAVAAENARRLRADSIRFFRSDLFTGLGPDWRGFFDTIVSNPPYIPTDAIRTLDLELHFEPGVALDGGSDGLAVIRRIAAEAPLVLRSGGRLFLEIGFDQGERVSKILASRGFREVRVHRDLEGHDRVVTGEFIGPV